ncbi:MAG: hypothetical protein EBT47_10240 [Chloroflexi bacterium]|nr:hypothetical protein [Chloroflexota bacterium]
MFVVGYRTHRRRTAIAKCSVPHQGHARLHSSAGTVVAPVIRTVSTLEVCVTTSVPAEVRPIRLALVGIAHETNTFSDVPARYESFEADGILRGDEILAVHATAQTTVAGFLEVGSEPGVTVVPLLYTTTGPCAQITSDAFGRIVGEIIDLLQKHGPWDGVLTCLSAWRWTCTATSPTR